MVIANALFLVLVPCTFQARPVFDSPHDARVGVCMCTNYKAKGNSTGYMAAQMTVNGLEVQIQIL